MSIDKPNRDIKLLAPQFYEMVDAVLIDLKSQGLDAGIYEAWRSDDRQRYLWESGRSRPGPIVTNAKPGQSAHNWGLGADLTGKVNGKWTWDEKQFNYKLLRETYKKHGLQVVGFEYVHCEFIGNFKHNELQDYARIYGLNGLWERVFNGRV